MKDLLGKMIIGLRKQVNEMVPEKGPFPVVYEREDVSDMKIGLSHLILKVSDVGVKGFEDKRYLEFAAVNHPSPYSVEGVVGFGSTQDILALLREDELLEKLLEKVQKYAADIDYEERHPRG